MRIADERPVAVGEEGGAAKDDGVRLFLDDKLIVAGGWRDQADTEYFSEPVTLNQGQRVKVHLQFYDNSGPATARLRWNGPGGREAVPSVFLFPTVAANDARPSK